MDGKLKSGCKRQADDEKGPYLPQIPVQRRFSTPVTRAPNTPLISFPSFESR